MKQVFYHYTKLEEFALGGGMWKIVASAEARSKYSIAARNLMADPIAFELAMIRAMSEWPNSCEAALTSQATNHQAWFGHAGCFLGTGSPEDCTRLGWHMLDNEQQRLANLAADNVIATWKRRYAPAGNAISLFEVA